MLGVMKSRPTWQWAARGKHPAARDFIRLGGDFPFAGVFSDWIVKGYEKIASQKRPETDHVSWRFWARGSTRDGVICGILKDSSDAVGRRYPFLIIGTGNLDEWETDWDLLPRFFEKTWDRIEHIAAQRATDVKKLEMEIRGIGQPRPSWSEVRSAKEEMADCGVKSTDGLFRDGFAEYADRISHLLAGSQESLIPLDDAVCRDQIALIDYWHCAVKDKAQVPSASFMGGPQAMSSLVFFHRPLVPDDFIRLWTTSPADQFPGAAGMHKLMER